jgi:Zn-dependent protease with chaperone function
MLRAFLAQSILHALVAALLVEALLKVWRIADGAWRLRFRLIALAAPLLWLPLLFVLAPGRRSPFFVGRVALFAGERWNLITIADQGLGNLLLLFAAGLGSALFLRDALPTLRELLRGGGRTVVSAPFAPAGSAVAAAAGRHAERLGTAPPDVHVIRAGGPVLLCEGARYPRLVVSEAAVAQLDPEALDAAVAHEVAHASYRDPAWGYLLLTARALLFFNPASQWVARTVVDDIERRADQAAVRLTGRPDALARAITRLFETVHPPPNDADASFERVFWHVRREGVLRRCQRLRERQAPESAPLAGLQLALAAGAVLVLLVFVV